MNDLNWKKSITRFLTAQTISLFGSSLVQYAIVWYITLTTSSGKMLTISTLCGFLPQILISLFAGVWIDRYDRKLMIMLSDSVIAVSTLLLAIAFLSGHKRRAPLSEREQIYKKTAFVSDYHTYPCQSISLFDASYGEQDVRQGGMAPDCQRDDLQPWNGAWWYSDRLLGRI